MAPSPWFGLEPVDATTLGGGVLARDGLDEVTAPLAILGAEVSSPCSPAADSYATLFPLAPSPTVLVTGLGAGYTQLQSQDTCVCCIACFPGGDADAAVVLAYSVRYVTAFMARELLDDATVGAAFAGAGAADDVAAGLVTVESR